MTADARIVGACAWDSDGIVADFLIACFIASPAVVQERTKGEREIGGGENDKVEVAEKE